MIILFIPAFSLFFAFFGNDKISRILKKSNTI